jgi:hypothetical protein
VVADQGQGGSIRTDAGREYQTKGRDGVSEQTQGWIIRTEEGRE